MIKKIYLFLFGVLFVGVVNAQTVYNFDCSATDDDSVRVTITEPSCFGVFDGEVYVEFIPDPTLPPIDQVVPANSISIVGTNNGFQTSNAMTDLDFNFTNLQPDEGMSGFTQMRQSSNGSFRICVFGPYTVDSIPPFISGPIEGTSELCSGITNEKYYVTANAGSNYTWSTSVNASINSQDGDTVFVSFTGGDAEVYVNEISSTGCNGLRDTLSVTVNSTPVAPIITGNTFVCSDTQNEPYSSSGLGTSTYNWMVTGATINQNNGQDITVDYGTSNAVIQVEEVSDAGCASAITSVNVTVETRPTTLLTGNTTVCENAIGEVYSATTETPGNTHFWEVNGATLATNNGDNILVDFGSTDATVRVAETSAAGCPSDTVELAVSVITKPSPTINGNSSICENTSGEIYSLTGNLPGSTFEWFVSGATLVNDNGDNIELDFGSTNAVIKVVETPAGASTCKSDTTTFNITVNPEPNTVVTGNTTVCENASGETYAAVGLAGSTYLWTVTGATLVTDNGDNIVVDFASTNAVVTVTETSVSGCPGATVITNVNVITKPVPVLSGEVTVCENTTGEPYNVTGLAGSTYEWFVNNATIATNTGDAITVDFGATNAVVRVVETPAGASTCKSDTVDLPITIETLPVTTIAGLSPLCENTTGETYTASGPVTSTYVWTATNATLVSQTGNTADFDFGTSNATINVVETSATGCTGTQSSFNVNIITRPIPVVTGSLAVCENTLGETYTVTGLPTSTFEWFVDNATIVGPSTGTSVVLDFAANDAVLKVLELGVSCESDTVFYPITVNPLPVITTNGNQEICTGDSVQITAGGGTNYSWKPVASLTSPNNASTFAKPTITTTYTVVVESNLGCIDSTTLEVAVNDLPVAAIVPLNPSICIGESVTLTASGGDNYLWTPNTGLSSTNTAVTDASPTSDITYNVEVTDANGCIANTATDVTVNSLPIANASANPTVICMNNPVQLNTDFDADYTYSWTPVALLGDASINNPIATPTSLTDTDFEVTVTDLNGCQNTSTVSITINSLPTAGIVESSPITICGGNSTTINATGGGDYLWKPSDLVDNPSSSSITATPTSDTTFTVIVTDGNGCQDSTDVKVLLTPSITLDIVGNDTICQGDVITLTANATSSVGPVAFSWTPVDGTIVGGDPLTNTIDVRPTSNKTYSVEASDGVCVNTMSIDIEVIPTLAFQTVSNDTSFCLGETVTLTAEMPTADYTYSWTPITGVADPTASTTDVTPTTAGTIQYNIQATHIVALGCPSDTMINVTVEDLPTINVSASKTVVCAGDTVDLSATGGVNYAWSPNVEINDTTQANAKVFPTSTRYYIVEGDNAFGCTAKDSVRLNVIPLPTVTASATPSEVCIGEEVQLLALPTGFSSFSWTPTAGLNDPTIAFPKVTPLFDTDYIVEATDGNGCVGKDTVSVTVNTAPVFTTSSDTTICEQDTITIQVNTAPVNTFVWSPNTEIEDVSLASTKVWPSTNRDYKVVVTGVGGCADSAFVKIAVNAIPTGSITTSADTSCFGEDAVFTLSLDAPSLPNAAGTYSIDGGATYSNVDVITFAGTTAGDVNVSALFRDNVGCISNPEITADIHILNELDFDTTITSTPDCANPNGEVVVDNIVGGLLPYTITHLPSNTVETTIPATFSGLGVGVNSFVVEDKVGCQLTKAVSFTGPVTFDTTLVDPTCFGSADGSIALANIAGGTSPYEFKLDTVGSTYKLDSSFTNLVGGAHTVLIKDATGCELSVLLSLNEPAEITIAELAKTDIFCKGDTGSIEIEVLGGTEPLTITLGADIQTGAGVYTYNDLASGNYTVNVVDGMACSNSYSFDINKTKNLKSYFSQIAEADCKVASGQAEIDSTVGASGLYANYQYSFVGTNSFTDSTTFATNLQTLNAGVYTVVTRDALIGCHDTTSFTITRTAGIDIPNINIDVQTSCTNVDGSISLSNITGGAPRPYMFELRDLITDTVVVAQQTDSSFTNLVPQQYKVVIYDAVDCPEEIPVDLATASNLNIAVDTIHASCNLPNGEITVTISGGTLPYFTSLNDTLGWSGNTGYQNLVGGDYTVYAKDNSVPQACYDSVKVTLRNDVDKPSGTIVVDADTVCFQDPVIITATLDAGYVEHASGAYSFDLGNTFTSQNTFTYNSDVVGDTTFSVVFKDAVGCSVSDTFTVDVHVLTPLSFNVDTTIVPTCTVPGELQINGYTGGKSPYGFVINGDTTLNVKDTTLADLSPGVYTFTLFDSKGCFTTQVIDLTGVLTFDTDIQQPLCFGESNGYIEIFRVRGGTAPYNFSFQDTLSYQQVDTARYTGLSSGLYIVYIKDADGCVVPVSVPLSDPDSLSIREVGFLDISCTNPDKGGEIRVEVAGGTQPLSVDFDGMLFDTVGTYVFDTLSAGLDTIYVSDANGCNVFHAFEVVDQPEINTYISQLNPGECNQSVGQAVIDSSTGGSSAYLYKYISDLTFVDELSMESKMDNLPLGSYSVVTQDAALGCLDTTVFNIRRNNGVDSLDLEISNSCNDVQGFINVLQAYGTAPRPYMYELQNALDGTVLVPEQVDSNFADLGRGFYTIVVNDATDCKDYFAAEIAEPSEIDFFVNVVHTTCGEDNGAIQISQIMNGTLPYKLTLNDTLSFDIINDSIAINDLAIELYNIEITDESTPNCNVDTKVYVPTDAANAKVNFSDATCYGGANGIIQVDTLYNTDTLKYSYEWSLNPTANFGTDSIVDTLSKGEYTLYIKETNLSNGFVCVYEDWNLLRDVTIGGVFHDSIVTTIIPILEGDSLWASYEVEPSKFEEPTGKIIVNALNGGAEPYQLKLDTGSFEVYEAPKVFENLAQTEVGNKVPYVLTIADSAGCEYAQYIDVLSGFYVPNIITVNGDGKNDYLRILGVPEGTRIRIFDRWGVLAYESWNYQNDHPWKGEGNKTGTYFYEIFLPDESTHTGWIKVIR